MDIKIHYAYPLHFPFTPQVPGGNGYVVEIAKSHDLAHFCMMSGRPDSAEGIVYLSLHQEIDGIENAAYSQHRGFKGLGAYFIIGMIKLAQPPITRFLKPQYEFDAVHNLNPLLVSPAGLDGSHFGDKASLFNPLVNLDRSCGTLRMFGSGFVEQKPFVVQKSCPSHCAISHLITLKLI